MTTYRVEADGVEVWSDTTDDYAGLSHFPVEYRQRPAAGVVCLFVDGEIIATNIPHDSEV